MAHEKYTVCFTIEKSFVDTLKSISETRGPSSARIIERAVEEYLKDKDPEDIEEEKTKKQMSFYPSEEVYKKLIKTAMEEGRSVSNLVSYIIKKHLKKEIKP